MTIVAQILPPTKSDRRVARADYTGPDRRSGINRRSVARPAGVCAIIGMLAAPGFAKADTIVSHSPAAITSQIAGTYVGSAPTGAFLLELASVGKDQVSGHYEQVQKLPNGTLQDANFTVAGATSNGTMAVVIKLANGQGAPIAAFGSIEQGVLHLSSVNGGGLALTLHKADGGNFRAQVAALADQSGQGHAAVQPVSYQPTPSAVPTYQQAAFRPAQIQPTAPAADAAVQPAFQRAPAVTQNAALLAHLDNLLQAHADFVAKAAQQLDRFDAMEGQFHEVTQKMRASLTLEESMANNGQALNARSQLNGAIRRTAFDTQQLHLMAQSDENQVEAVTAALARDTDAANQACHQQAFGASPDIATACARLLGSAQEFQQQAANLRRAMQHIEATWLAEKHEGDALLAESDAARG